DILMGANRCLPSPAPRPSLSLHPGDEVALGDNVTLRCHTPRNGVQVIVYKEGDGNYRWQRDGARDTTEVLVRASTNKIAGRFRCRFETLAPTWATGWSDPVELVVLADSSFPPPALSLSPRGRVETGADVTISCRSPHGATFVLHKAGSLDPVQRVIAGTAATFTLRGVTPADAGTYGCSYRPHENPFVSSHPRAEVTLEVTTGGPSTPFHTPPPG
ncbi:GPVI protein, partial [Crypturellus soui]|nr:GPVI protein [Crypturellus soui]